MASREHVIDVTGLVAGRVSSVVAKRLLKGEKIIIVNAEESIVVGKPESVIRGFRRRLDWRTRHNPEKRGPKIPRRPDLVMKRMIRGMLPKKARGREAAKRLMIYIGVPEKYSEARCIQIEEARPKSSDTARLTLGEIYEALGGTS